MRSKFNFTTYLSLLIVVMMVGFTSCKSKKKIAGVANPQEVKNQIEEELSEETEEVKEPVRVAVKPLTKTQKLENYFAAISEASNVTAANNSINEALTLFSGPNAPVLITIYRKDGTVDYDEPTTIRKYLEYLKDTKNNKAQVEEMVMDDYGNIKELVLKK